MSLRRALPTCFRCTPTEGPGRTDTTTEQDGLHNEGRLAQEAAFQQLQGWFSRLGISSGKQHITARVRLYQDSNWAGSTKRDQGAKVRFTPVAAGESFQQWCLLETVLHRGRVFSLSTVLDRADYTSGHVPRQCPYQKDVATAGPFSGMRAQW
jgi:hypothetical protein